MELNLSATTLLTMIVGNTTQPTTFENPFSRPLVSAVFSTIYSIVFTVCLIGKLSYCFIRMVEANLGCSEFFSESGLGGFCG